MERQKIINDLLEWQGKDEEKRAFILILAEQSDEYNIQGSSSVKGKKVITCAALADAMRNMPDLFKDASRFALVNTILKEKEGKTDKDTNADIN